MFRWNRQTNVVIFLLFLGVSAGIPAAAEEPDPDEAREKAVIDRFVTVLEKNPRRGTALDRIYGHHVERGTLDSLIVSYRDKVARAKSSEAATAWMIVGLMESLRGRDASSVEAFGQAAQFDPASYLAPYYRGQALVLVGQPDKAAEEFERAIARKPAQADQLDIYQALGRVYQQAQQSDRALEVWNRLEKQFPNDVRVQEQIATTLQEEGEFAAALPRFESLIKLSKDRYRQSLFQIEAAEIKLRLGRRDEGVRDLEKLLAQLNPDNWLFREVRRRIEETFLRTDDQAGLIAYYEAWVKKNPEDLEAVSRLARLLAGLGRAPESQAWLEKGLKAAPSKKELRLALISQLVYEQKYPEAIAHYEQLDKHEPNNPDTLRDWGRLILKDTGRDEATRRKDAAAIWRRLMAAKPKDPLIVSQVAELFRQAEMIDEALELYRRAVQLAPEDAQYKEYLGEYFHALQRKDEALSVWKSIAEGKAKTAANVARLAEVLAGFGYLAEAIDTNAEACRLDPKEINLQIRRADLLSQAERHDEALVQLATVRKLVASDEEREAWLSRELKELQSLKQLPDRIVEVRKGAESRSAQAEKLDKKSKQELADRWYWVARACEAERQWKEAGQAIVKATDLAPQSIPILTASGRIMESQMNLLAAAEINSRLAAIDRRYRTEYLKKVAHLEVSLGRRDRALQAGRDVIAAAPGNPDLYEFFSQLCFQLGENDEGLQALRRSVRVNPTELKGLMSLAAALAEQFRTDEAIELYWRAFDKAGNLEDRLISVPKLTELYLQTNQFDRLLERLERQRREPNQQREMTICLAQAYQSAGDDGNARIELEKLLTEETRDTQLLQQLVKLCESDGDLDVAVRYQQQMNKAAPGKDGVLRLAQLLFKQGDAEQASALLAQMAADEKDPEQVLKSIDSMLASGREEQALRILSRLVREQPRNWELLYREGTALVATHPEEAALRFGAILALNVDDDEPSLASKSAGRRAARSPNSAVNQGIAVDDHSLSGRAQRAGEIRQIAERGEGFQSMQQQQQQPLWMPVDFGDARMAALAWQMSLAKQRGQSDDFLSQRKESLSQSPERRDLIDWYYVTQLEGDGPGQYQVLKQLSVRPDADMPIHKLYLSSLNQRDPGTDDETAEMSEPDDDDSEMTDEDPNTRWLPPLSEEELAHVLKIVEQLKAQPVDYAWDEWYLDLAILELKRAGRPEEGEKMFSEAVASAKTPLEMAVNLEGLIERNDYAKAHQIIGTLLDLAAKNRPTPINANGVINYEQYVFSPDFLCEILGVMMAKRVLLNEKEMADDELQDVLELWDRYLAYVASRPPVPPAQALTARMQRMNNFNGRQTNIAVWNKKGEQVGESIDFPPPNDVYDEASIGLLFQLFYLFREAEQPDKLIELFAARLKDPDLRPALRSMWSFGLGCLQWWNEDQEDALATLREVTETVVENLELKLSLASLYEERREFSEALELIDSLNPADQATMQQREVAALRLAVQSGDADRARLAATRLFGLRLDSHLQLALAKQMHQLGMHRQAEAVLARAGRQAGNRTDVLLNLMEQYAAADKTDVAVQIAYQLMRRTSSGRSSHGMGASWGMSGMAAHFVHSHSRQDGEDGVRAQALQVLNRSGKLPEMIERVETQLKKAPKSQRLLETLVEYHTAAGNDKQVETLNQQLAESMIDDPRYRFQLAMKLLNSGKLSEATDHLLIVLQKDPNLVIHSFWNVMNAFRNERKWAEFQRLLDAIDVKALRANPWFLPNIVSQLSYREETKSMGMQFFHKVWKELPDARSDLLSGIHTDDFWRLPDVLDYVRQGIIPSERVASRNRWHGLGMAVGYDDGKVKTLGTRFLDLGASQQKLDTLAEEVSAAVEKMPTWSGGKALLGLINLRRGRVEEGKGTLESLLSTFGKPSDENAGQYGTAQTEIGQELMSHESCIELALRYFELATQNGDDNEADFQNSPERLMVQLFKKQGRREDARQLLLRSESSRNNQFNEHSYEFHHRIENCALIAEEYRELGYFGDAIRVYQQTLMDQAGVRSSGGWGDPQELAHKLRQGLNSALAQVKSESIVELLTPPPKIVVRQGSPHQNRRRRQQAPRKPSTMQESERIDLLMSVDTTDLEKARLSSALVTVMGRIGSQPELLAQANRVLAEFRARRPDDFGAAILAAELALQSNDRVVRKSGVDDLVALIERQPLESAGGKGTLTKQLREAALWQIPVWLIARDCLSDKVLREGAEKLAARAVQAAERHTDNQYTLAILREWGQAAIDAGDTVQAEKTWSRLLDEILPKPGSKNRNVRREDDGAAAQTIATLPGGAAGVMIAVPGADGPSAAKGRVVTMAQFEQAAQLALFAAKSGLLELSMRAMSQALHGGPPLEAMGDADQNNPFGTRTQVNMNSGAAESIHARLTELEQIWKGKGATDQQIYELVRGAVFCESRPLEAFLYPVPLANTSDHQPQSVAGLLVRAAIRAGKTDDLKALAEKRLQQPLGELSARILLAQLALASRDTAAVAEQLSLLSDRLKQDSLEHTSDLCCHVALPAMTLPEVPAIAVTLMDQIVDHLHKSIQTSRGNGQQEPVMSLTFRLAGYYFQHGQAEAGKKLLESWILLQGPLWSRHGGDYPAYQRKMANLNAAGAMARGGLVSESLVMLGRYADTVTPRDYHQQSPFADSAVILSGLQALEASQRYEQLKGWTLPTKDRLSVRIVVALLPADRAPAAFDAVRGPAPRAPQTARLSSTLDLLIEAAQQLGKLDELQSELEPHAAANVENAALALARTQIANGQGAKALPLLNELCKTRTKEDADQNQGRRNRNQNQVNEIVLARAALYDSNPEVREQGRWLSLKSLNDAQHCNDTGMLLAMRRALRSAAAGSQVADNLDVRMSDTGLKHWVAGSTTAASVDHQVSSPALWWIGHEQMLAHACGLGSDYVHFAYPLTGQFELECAVVSGTWEDGSIGFGGLAFEQFHGSQITIMPMGRWSESVDLPSGPDAADAFNRIKLTVRDGDMACQINGHPIYTVRAVPGTFPFFILSSRHFSETVFRNIRITGTPVIPREVSLVTGKSLLGWASNFYDEAQPRFLPAKKPDDEDSEQTERDVTADVADWHAENGEIHGRLMPGSAIVSAAPRQSRLYYVRPLRNRETLRYEFWYAPGDGGFQTHPALDRLAFLLEPGGVRVHWMTPSSDSFYEAGLPAANAIDEPDNRRGSGPLPLKPGDWNQVELKLADDVVSLELNGTTIYQRPLERNNTRQFGLFHDKSRHAVRVRNVVLSGDWPKTLSAEIRDNLLEPTRPPTAQERRGLAQVIDEKFHAMCVDDILLQTRALPLEQRFAALKNWVLPSDDHATFRLYGAFSPADPIPVAPFQFPSAGTRTTGAAAMPVSKDAIGLRQRTGGELIAPALDLVAVAAELGRLDDLEAQLRDLSLSSPTDQRCLHSLMGLVALAKGNISEVQLQLAALTPDKKVGLSDSWQVHERWPEFLLAWQSARIPKLRQAARNLVDLIVDSHDRKSPGGSVWQTMVRAAQQRLQPFLDDVESIPRPLAVSPRKQWAQVTLADSHDRSSGLLPVWNFDRGQANHLGGFGRDLLYYQSPLRGKFAVEAELTTFSWRETRLMYSTQWAGPSHTHEKFDVGNLTTFREGGLIAPKLEPLGDWYTARLEIEPGRATYFANGRKYHTIDLPPTADPWLAVYSGGHYGGGFRSIRILGEPEIPTEINITAQKELVGWWAETYMETISGSEDGSEWSRSNEEILGRKRPNEQGRFSESLLQYHRPMLEDGEFAYEFYYVPDQTLVHPALGRAAFLLDASGVNLHWMTDAEFERTGLDPGNIQVEPDCRRSVNLPLKPAAWNQLKLALRGQVLTLTLNGELIYQRPMEPSNQRQFGLFHYSGDTDVRVRNVVYRGDWPRTLPPLKEQEFAGDVSTP